jgi:tetratricopeptide (TPR) repeat protein
MRRLGGALSKQSFLRLAGISLLGLLVLGSATGAAGKGEAPAPPCEQGRALENLGRFEAAEAAYSKDLETKAGLKCGQAGLEQLKKQKRCARAEALAAADQKAKAEEAFDKVLEADPKQICASAGLAALQPDQDWWEWTATAVKDAATVLGAIALAFVILLLTILIVLQIATRVKPWKRHWPANRILRPSIEVKALDDTGLDKKLGPQVASLIRERVTPRREGGIDLVTGHVALSETLKPLSEASSETKAAFSVFSALEAMLPRRNFEVSGALQQKGPKGRGISIELTNSKRNVGQASFWEHEFVAPDEEVEAYQRLSVPAAAWIDHALATAVEDDDLLLSSSPHSWALFKAGAARQSEGDVATARVLYEAALENDPDNAGARANLGVSYMRSREYERAEKMLERALELLGGAAG